MNELKVYVIDINNEIFNNSNITDNDFKQTASCEGEVLSLKEFERRFNGEMMSDSFNFIRIL